MRNAIPRCHASKRNIERNGRPHRKAADYYPNGCNQQPSSEKTKLQNHLGSPMRVDAAYTRERNGLKASGIKKDMTRPSRNVRLPRPVEPSIKSPDLNI
jgi:hypothetical protein